MRRYVTGAVCMVVLVGWLVAGTSAAQTGPTTVTLGTVALAVGETTPIEAVIDCQADGCSAFAITVRFDPAVLRVESAEIGPYLGDEVLEVENRIDAEAGTVRLAAVVLGAWQEPESDVLFVLNVTGQTAGVTALSVSSLEVADAVGNPTPAEGISGVTVVEAAAATPFPTDTPTSEPAQPADTPSATRVPLAVVADDDAFLGPDDAPVVMVEFADFQCPYCARFYDETLPLMLEKYPNELRFVYRDLVVFGEDSIQAAMAAECAEEQDAFWAMHDRLFEENLSQGGQVASENLIGVAEAIGLDTDAFSECMSSQRYRAEVLADYEAAQALGLTGTPSFLVNGELVVGAQPFEAFDAIIQAELERTGYEPATATSTPEAAACPVPDGWVPYVVQAGDILFAIYRAMAGDVTFEYFMQANCVTEDVLLSVGQVLYVPQPAETSAPEEMIARFGESIILRTAEWSPTALPGETLIITLEWSTTESLATSYSVTALLSGDTQEVFAQHDSIPGNGQAPTIIWTPGTPVVDSHILTLPVDLPPGPYRVIVVVYSWEDGTRLVTDAGEDRLVLGTVTVETRDGAGAAEEGVFLPAGSSNSDWTPVIREFDGVEMVLVPAGCVMMGSEDGDLDERPVHEVCFEEPFWIDRYEVTNAQYGSEGHFSDPNRPRESVASWFAARMFCVDRGGRLPSEAEWEYAARGPEGWVYPWGNTFAGDFAVYGANSNNETSIVGSRLAGASWVGALDMSGNVAEWVNSSFRPYPYQADDGREMIQAPAAQPLYVRVFRGGTWYDSEDELRATTRQYANPYDGNYGRGFRCARSMIHVNSASADELATLPGIGPVNAQAIIEYREQHGPFARVDDLVDVPGIGPAIWESIRDLVMVD